MSRSYKKAYLKMCPDKGKDGKRFANRRVRRSPGIPDGSWYKMVYSSYDIHDWHSDMRWGLGDWLPLGAKKTRAGWVIPK